MTGAGSGGRRRGEGGASVLEVLLSLLLGLLLVGLVVGLMGRSRAAARSLTVRADRLTTVRVARTLLALDGPGRSPGGVGSDSLAVRAYRGTALFCEAGPEPGEWRVEVVGVRNADPSKDSVRVLGGDGAWAVHHLADRVPDPGGCDLLPGGGRPERWRLEPSPASPRVGRYFERGSYHLSGGAFRYRRGDGGRQPLTPEVLAAPESGFVERGGGTMARLRFLRADRAGGASGDGEWIVSAGAGEGGGG